MSLPKIDNDKLMELHKEGKTVAEIGQFFGVLKESVYSHLRTIGIKMKHKDTSRPKKICDNCGKISKLDFSPLVETYKMKMAICSFCNKLLFK